MKICNQSIDCLAELCNLCGANIDFMVGRNVELVRHFEVTTLNAFNNFSSLTTLPRLRGTLPDFGEFVATGGCHKFCNQRKMLIYNMVDAGGLEPPTPCV